MALPPVSSEQARAVCKMGLGVGERSLGSQGCRGTLSRDDSFGVLSTAVATAPVPHRERHGQAEFLEKKVGWFFSMSREPGMCPSQQVLWGPPSCPTLHVPLILKDRGAAERLLPARGNRRRGICVRSISKPPDFAFRHARPLPTTLSKYERWPVGAPCTENKRIIDLVAVNMPSSAVRGPGEPHHQPGQPPGKAGCPLLSPGCRAGLQLPTPQIERNAT